MKRKNKIGEETLALCINYRSVDIQKYIIRIIILLFYSLLNLYK